MKVNGFTRSLHFVHTFSRLAAGVALVALLWPGIGAAQASRAEVETRKSTGKLYREGDKALRAGDYDKAIQRYDAILERDNTAIRAHLSAALAHLKNQYYQRCYDHAAEVLRMDPDNARAHALQGMALLRSGYVGPAVEALKQAFQYSSREPMAFGALAEIDFYEGRAKEARMRAFTAHHLDPDEPDYLITIARAASRLEYFGEAAEAYQRFLDVAPKTDDERRDRIMGLIKFYRRLAGLQVHEVDGPKTVSVPFRLGTDRRPYIQVEVNGKPATFVIDTGSGFTVISDAAAKRLGVKEVARGGNSQGVGGTGKFPIVYGLLKSVDIGDMRIKSVPCFIRPFHSSGENIDERRADGFIGLSILSHFLSEIDYKDHQLILDRDTDTPVASLVSPDAVVVPFRTTQNGLISVESELDGNHRINMILDSGASSSVISKSAVERLNLSDRIIKGQTVRVIGAAGVADDVPLLFLRNYSVAGLKHDNVRALILDFTAINETSGFEQGGILGGDFLRNFRLKIDFAHGQLAFEPHSTSITRIQPAQQPN